MVVEVVEVVVEEVVEVVVEEVVVGELLPPRPPARPAVARPPARSPHASHPPQMYKLKKKTLSLLANRDENVAQLRQVHPV